MLSVDGSSGVVRTLKSFTSVFDDGNLPPKIPVTVATPTNSICDDPTLTTLPAIGSLSSPTTDARSLY